MRRLAFTAAHKKILTHLKHDGRCPEVAPASRGLFRASRPKPSANNDCSNSSQPPTILTPRRYNSAGRRIEPAKRGCHHKKLASAPDNRIFVWRDLFDHNATAPVIPRGARSLARGHRAQSGQRVQPASNGGRAQRRAQGGARKARAFSRLPAGGHHLDQRPRPRRTTPSCTTSRGRSTPRARSDFCHRTSVRPRIRQNITLANAPD